MTARTITALALGLLLQFLFSTQALAHAVGTSYIQISSTTDSNLKTRVDLSLRDLEFAVGLDTDGDGRITWNEVTSRTPTLTAYVQRSLSISRGNRDCVLGDADLSIDRHADEVFAVLDVPTVCSDGGAIRVHSDLFFELDNSHRLLLTVSDNETTAVTVLTDSAREWTQSSESDALRAFGRFVVQGVWHIWIGFDHLAFLMLLLLPLMREQGNAPQQLKKILKVVTAFTVAHSITLISAALGALVLPSRWVEAAIAASIVFAAVANLLNVSSRYGIAMAFGFGLIHGVGFASALADLAVDAQHRVLALLGFNLGVEVGQLAVVVAVFPILFIWARSPRLKQRAMVAGSAAMGMLGVAWLLQRTVLG